MSWVRVPSSALNYELTMILVIELLKLQQLTYLLNCMTTLTIDAIARFLKTCEAVDLPNEYPSVSDILMQFDAPSVDQQRDIRLWEDAEGQLIALAGLMIPTVGKTVDGFLWFRVHPTQQVDSLYRNIITWAEARMQESLELSPRYR